MPNLIAELNTHHPEYKKLREQLNQEMKSDQDWYTDTQDKIAEKKIRKLLNIKN